MCELCDIYEKRKIKTKLHYEDKKVIVVDCLTCRIPMVVLKRHTMEPNNFELGHMEMVSKELFGPNIKFRKKQRRILDHLHWHILNIK